jgi:hypothetical protein
MGKVHTLHLHSPSRQVCILVVALLLLYGSVGEVVMQANVTRSVLGVPSIGSADRGFEGRLDALRSFAAHRKSVDCIFLGDSTAMTDFAPNVFADSFHDVTGSEIECFNFGAGAFTLADMAALIQIVVREYSPRLIIVGVEALNFAVSSSEPAGADFAQLPWTKYKLGEFTIEGWLFEHSALYPRLGTIRHLLTLETTPSKLRSLTSEINKGWENGYFPLKGPNTFDVAQPPDPTSSHPYHENYFGSLTDFQPLAEHLSALDQILALNSPSTQVVIVEMPVARNFFHYFKHGKQDYQKFISVIEHGLSGTTVPFWQTTHLQMFQDEQWFNYNHLNESGAQILSRWLGNQFGHAVVKGTLRFAPHADEANRR